MKFVRFTLMLVLAASTIESSGSAEVPEAEAPSKTKASPQAKTVEQDRKILSGSWQVTEMRVNGNLTPAEDAAKLSVENESDGTWSVRSEGQVISRGTSNIDPTARPKTIDFTVTEGGGVGDSFLGIYELRKNRRRLCFAPAEMGRPTAFRSDAEGKQVLVMFRRETDRDEVDRPVAFDSLPARVKAGLLDAMIQHLDDFSITEAEREKHDGKPSYEIELTIGDQSYEAKLSPAGKLLEWEPEDGEEEEDDDDE